MHFIEQHNARPTSFSTELEQLSHKVEYYHVLSRAPYTWAKHAAHHIQADFFLIDPSLDHRSPLTGLQDHRSWRRHFQHQSRPLLESLPWNFTFPSVTALSVRPYNWTHHIVSCASYFRFTWKKRINEARNKIPNHSPSHCLPSRKQTVALISIELSPPRHIQVQKVLSFWMPLSLKQSELINTSL